VRDDHHIAPRRGLVDRLADQRAPIAALGQLGGVVGDPHRPARRRAGGPALAEALQDPKDHALAAFGIRHRRGVDALLLRGPRDDLLVHVPEAEPLGDERADPFALGARRSRDRDDPRSTCSHVHLPRRLRRRGSRPDVWIR
jgi:hypothetical protein